MTTPYEVESDLKITSYDREEYERMEKWLDEHQDFLHDYFSRKATRQMIDGWLIAHALTSSNSPPGGDTGSNGSNSRSNSKSNSGANTPVRKISAQEFEKGGHILSPMVSTVDGMPTFLSHGNPESAQAPSKSRKSRNELKAMDERELLYELVMDICNDLDITSLCYKILQNVSLLLNADRCSLFLVEGNKEYNNRCLVSKLFDVNANSSLEDGVEKSKEIRVKWGTGIIGYVAETGEAQNIPDAYQDSRFNNAIDLMTGYRTCSILSMPIKDLDGQVVGVAQAINKISVKDEPFDEHDEKVFASYLAFCGIGLRNAHLYTRSQLENRRNQLLLDLARVIFEEQSNVAALIHKIMMHTQSLLRCERCQVLLVDETSKDKKLQTIASPYQNPSMGVFSQVFDLQASDFDNDDSYHREGTQEPRFPINIGLTGYVAATGETLNIPDAYQDPRFDPKVDEECSFRTRSILCMPIKNANGQVIGVAQLVNKLDDSPFNQNDQNLFEAFAIFCGMGIHNTQMFEHTCRAMARQTVALEVLSYHASAPMEEVDRLKNAVIPSAQEYKLLEYNFSEFPLDDDNTVRATVRMFLDLDLINSFHITYDVFIRWILSVKKNYRNVTYHNWRHAFSVAQTMFAIMTRGEMSNMLGDIECLALLVGCLCHDLDHRGTNNQWQIKTMSPLAQLYSTSTMEHHHFDQCVMIMNSKNIDGCGNNIFCNLSAEDYNRVMKMLENAILATDLALYFRYRGQFLNLVESDKVDWTRGENKELLRAMMMTACDLSAITKPWEVQKRVAQLIASEFFDQGDMEKEKLNVEPIDMLNRDKEDELPTMQVGYVDTVCLPVYKAFAKFNDKLAPLLEGCEQNRQKWEELSQTSGSSWVQSKTYVDQQDKENHDKDEEEDEYQEDPPGESSSE